MVIKSFPNIGNNIQKLVRGKHIKRVHRVTGITPVQLKERKQVNVGIGKKIWPFYKKKQQRMTMTKPCHGA